jgi:tetratricopeptide (TPR) repeat protein
LYLKAKNYAAAVPVLERAVQLMPNRAEAHLNLGAAYRGAGQLVKAQMSFNQALRLRPTYPAAQFNLGVLFLDAPSFPGMDYLQQMNRAVAYFNAYKQQVTYLPKDDPVEDFIAEAQKKHKRKVKDIEREKKRRAREARRQQREAAKKAAAAAEAAKKAPAAPAAGGQKPPAAGGGTR